MRTLILILAAALGLQAQSTTGADAAVTSLGEVRRIYVAQLTGSQADMLRDLIIASLDATKLFVLTDNEERADAVLKGSADDHVFTDVHNIREGLNVHESGGGNASGGTFSKGAGGYGGISIGDTQVHNSKERKHEAFATVRLCNKSGDVIWSTTQESLGAKFRGASADVAAKVAKQMVLDLEKTRK